MSRETLDPSGGDGSASRGPGARPAQAPTIGALLARLYRGERLDSDEATEVMGRVMDGAFSPVQIAALLAALHTRGESIDELYGFAVAMRARSLQVPRRWQGPLVDTCGTGGTALATINVSTAAAFAAAASGVRVAKHGNHGVTKRSGSADMLEALGARLDLPAERVADAIAELGVAFVYARSHHPAMRVVAPVRAELQARTVFNLLGPLTNPAGADRQLLGVSDPALVEPFAQVLARLGAERALVVHGDGLDDLTVWGESVLAELHPDGRIELRRVRPEELGVRTASRAHVLGGGPADNAAATRAVLGGGGPRAHTDVVALAAGAAIYLGGAAADLRTGVEQALDTLADGRALELLERYVAFTTAQTD